jgi:hypothetical protein
MRPRKLCGNPAFTREFRWECHNVAHRRVTSSNLRRQIGIGPRPDDFVGLGFRIMMKARIRSWFVY